MSDILIYKTVRTYLEANWNYADVPIAWENETYEPPNRTPWIYCELSDSEYVQGSIGSGSPSAELWRESGSLMFRVNVAFGSGTEVADQIVLNLRTILRGLELPSAIRFLSLPTVGRGRVDTIEGNWYGVWLLAEWERDNFNS